MVGRTATRRSLGTGMTRDPQLTWVTHPVSLGTSGRPVTFQLSELAGLNDFSGIHGLLEPWFPQLKRAAALSTVAALSTEEERESHPPQLLDRAISAMRGVSAEASELPEHSAVGKQRASQGRSQALHGDSTP